METTVAAMQRGFQIKRRVGSYPAALLRHSRVGDASHTCRAAVRPSRRIRASSAARTRGKAASHFGWHAILRYVAAGIIPLGAGQMAASDGGNSLARFVTWLPPLPLAVQVQQSAARDWVHQPPGSQCLSAGIKPCAGTDFCPNSVHSGN